MVMMMLMRYMAVFMIMMMFMLMLVFMVMMMLVLMLVVMMMFVLVAMHYSITIAMQKGHIMVMISMHLV